MKNAFVFVFLLVSIGCVAGQPAAALTPTPVPAEMLERGRLVLKNAGCTIAPPGSGWNWMQYDKSGQVFVCVQDKTFEIYVVALDTLKTELSEHNVQSLIASARKTQEARGGTIEKDAYEFIEMPGVKKAARVTFTESDKSGKKQFAYVYAINTRENVVVKINCKGSYASEPAAFKSMVKSLKMKEEPAQEKKQTGK